MDPVRNVKSRPSVAKGKAAGTDRGREGEKKRKGPKGHPGRKRDRSQTASLSDGRPIDMVLSYRPMEAARSKRAIYAKQRRRFENELRAHGFELEYESKDMSRDGKTAYVKIHSPFQVLARQAEMRRVRKPTHPCDLPDCDRPKGGCAGLFRRIFHDPFRLQSHLEYPVGDYFTEPFRRKARDSFVGSGLYGGLTFFSPSERAWLTWDAMRNVQIEVKQKKGFVARPLVEIAKVTLDPQARFGRGKRPSAMPRLTSEESRSVEMPAMLRVSIDYLLETNVYEAAYPLHDCDLFDEEQYGKYKKKPSSKWPLRVYLYESWVRPSQLFRHQPLDAIRDYYGERVALYFAWLGFYTKMLIAPAIVGTLVLLHGGLTVGDDEFSKQSCLNQTRGEIVICRSCPYDHCDFKYLKAFCRMAKFQSIFDNELTVPYSLFTAIWAVVLLACWKRYRAALMTRWNVSEREDGRDEEPARPQYEMTAPARRVNPVTGKYEPYVSKRARFKRALVSAVTIGLCLLVVLGFVVGMMAYRVFGPYWWSNLLGDDEGNADYALIVSVTTSFANGVFIGIMSKIFRSLAVYLTRAENPRTESEFERAYTYKVVAFEWFNYYSTLFYLAFVRGQLPSAPQEQSLWEVQCPITGCLLDVVIRLAIIYIGKQALDTFVTIAAPLAKLCLTSCLHTVRRDGEKKNNVRWERDHELAEMPRMFLFAEYLRLFIQYCFITMFVPAFPIAPLFALVNNVFEIRLDAYRMLVLTRRSPPVPVRRPLLWEDLNKLVTRIAILTNALLIALTTDFVPRIVYHAAYGPDSSLRGYLDHILSEFNTSHWSNGELAHWHSSNNTVGKCYYRDYRVSPWEEDPHGLQAYGRRKEWWHVLVSRLAFILVFEHSIFLLQSVIEYLIPTVPARILRRQKREQHLQREKFMERENMKGKKKGAAAGAH